MRRCSTPEEEAMRTIDEIDSECAQAVLELGRKTYHRAMIDREIAELTSKVYDLNVEAYKVREALEAAKAQLAAEAKPAEAKSEEVANVEG